MAALVPRADRLDRQRLMFLAGQASVAGMTGPRSVRAGWVWPSAAAAMTAVAATLLVMLFCRPAPRVVYKTVYLPAVSSPHNVVQPERHRQIAPVEGEDATPLSRAQVVLLGPPSSLSLLASMLPGWLQYADGGLQNRQVPYCRLRDRVLSWGVDSWVPPLPMASGEGPAPPTGYRELLETLLEERA